MLNFIALISVGGTLAANLIGGYLAGIPMESPSARFGMAPGLRLLEKPSDSEGLLRGIRSTRMQRSGSYWLSRQRLR